MTLTDNTKRSAVISADQKYRYRLDRIWSRGHGPCTFIMLNPSTADGEVDDPTIRRCADFVRMQWGCSRLIVVNLFAFRATDPRELEAADSPVGRLNDNTIVEACFESELVVCAWGARGGLFGRDQVVLDMLGRKGFDLKCLGQTRDGHPKHPLYLPAKTPLEKYP